MLLNIVALLAGASAVIAESPTRPIAWYPFPDPPAQGYESISATFNIDPSSEWVTGYYAATQWFFQGHDVQYFGLQPFTHGTKNTTGHIAYSVFGKGTKSGDPNQCSESADGGAGTSCWLDIDLDPGRWYTIESKVVEKTAEGSRRWNGTLVDDTGKRTYIASFWTDKTYGGLDRRVNQWLEWWFYNGDKKTKETRECQRPFKVHFKRPIADGIVGREPERYPSEIEDMCAVAANAPNTKAELDAEGNLVISAGHLTKQ